VIPKTQKSFFYHYQVEVVEKPGTFLEIATTRPETIMADAAVAVNPADPRYSALIGLHVRRPLPTGVEALLPIIGDDAVDFEFGTGVLKVTPAHDKTDYEIGLRHNLPVVDIMNPDGTLNELAGDEFAGLDRFEARTKAVDKLRELNLLVKEEPHENNVGFSERADVPIEPRLSEQWFLKYPKTLEARDAVRNHLIRFFPDRWEKVYDHWLENIQDWCISRQLWWGHRIPVWYPANSALGDATNAKCQVESPGDGWVQDSDVLDTWFSSWLWAHETMDAPTLAKFYPTSVLVTGPDIIFFWVARMIMAGLEYTGEVPFKTVYFTGIIRDKQGRKMSKSLGNSPDPLDLIAKFGADGIRFGLLRIAPQGQDIKFDEQQIVEGRNFCNKLWNACRFRQIQGPIDPNADPSKHELSLFARDVLARLDATTQRVNEGYEAYRFSDIAQALYDFVWGDFCDRFIEVAKADFATDTPRRAGTLATLDYTIKQILRLLHPYAPFITEELWSGLGLGTESLMQSGWPTAGGFASDPRAALIYETVSKTRNLRATYGIPGNKRLPWQINPSADWLAGEHAVLSILLHAESITFCESAPQGHAACPTDVGIIYLPLEGIIDAATEKKRLHGEILKVEAEIEKVARKLSSESFVQNAPADVVADHRQRQQDWINRLGELQQAHDGLEG
jgi:valyl-tRNA synthetase